MEIIEQNLVPKNPKKKSEDGIVVTADFIAVIDGSTSKSDYRHSLLRSNGRQAMLLVSRYIRRMPKTTTCEQFMRGVTAYVRRHYKKSMLPRLAEHPEDRLTCSVVVYSRLNREIWMIGDCQALAIPHPSQKERKPTQQFTPPSVEAGESFFFDNPKPYEAELAAMRADEVRRQLADGKTVDQLLRNDTARPVIIPRMIETMRQQNTSYSVVDGFPIDRLHVRIVPLDFQPWEIVLASDGYPFLCPTLEESESRLRQQREDDPLNIGPRFQATKGFHPDFNSFDDRAYIRFSI
jgi:glycerophosphoryl diester phosphodiesterase